MGWFTDNKQDDLDKAADLMYHDMMLLSKILDHSNGMMNLNAKFYADKAENSIVAFCHTCKKYETTHNHVKWCGNRILITSVLMTVSGFANEIMQTTGHQFTKL